MTKLIPVSICAHCWPTDRKRRHSGESGGGKEILVYLGVSEGRYLVDILDSGVPFESNTLVHLD